MNNDQDTHKRILIATLLSFLFFVMYDQYLMPKQTVQQPQTQTQTQKSNNNSTQDSSKSAPTVTDTTVIGANHKTITEPTAPLQDNSKDIIATVELPQMRITIDSLGRVDQVTLKSKIQKDKDGNQIQLFKKFNTLRPLEVRYSNANVNSEAFKTNYKSSTDSLIVNSQAQKLILTQKLTSTTITKTITFYPDAHYDISIQSSNKQDFFITPGVRPDAAADEFVFKGAVIKEFDNTLVTIDDDELEESLRFKDAKIVASSDKYYTTALYDIQNGLNVIVDYNKDGNPLIFIAGKNSLNLHGYMGAKNHRQLNSIDPELTSIIEYGWFTFIAKPVFIALNYLHGIFGNWGWAIVVLTILMKIVLFPLTYKGMMSMQKLKVLAPKIKELQAKHKGNPQKSSAAMMELYKKHNANPMGGCLPMIMQIPIFFAMYRVLLNAIELKGAEWIFWIEDLAIMDPYFILPILMGTTMYIQQVITPTTITDPMQEKIFKYLPILFTFFFVTFPAGLTLYWFINNLFSIIQQYYINTVFEKTRAHEIQEHHKK